MTTKSNLLKVIRTKCSDCTCDQPKEIRTCHILDCALWSYRMGLDPTPTRSRNNLKIISPEREKPENNSKAIEKDGVDFHD